MHDRRLGPTTATLTIIERDLHPILELRTDCCGARIWLPTMLTTCPVCDRDIDRTNLAAKKERDLTHLKHHATRYWS